MTSLWVMLAAFIAVYFISDRIISPLHHMKSAVKEYAKGNFETQIVVRGNDEISELSAAINNMAKSLHHLETMRNSFLANVSHDLRTPMTTIAGFIDGINSGAIPPEKHSYYLGIISTEVHRLSRLVTELLDISKLESGDRKFLPEPFDVSEMARLILISFEQKIDAKRLDVSFETDEDSVIAFADKDAVHQVLYNLCDNAIKFAYEGGAYRISIRRNEKQKILVSVYNEGVGIAKEDLPFVFDRFYKTDKSRGLDKSGVGLGLYICKTIIDAHSEQIFAESPNDNGSEFWFTLKEAENQQKRR
jgi:signal transduction histidine kinase